MATTTSNCDILRLGKCPKIFCGDLVEDIVYNFGEVITTVAEYSIMTRWNQVVAEGNAVINGSTLTITNLFVTMPDTYYVDVRVNGVTRRVATIKVSEGRHCEEFTVACVPAVVQSNTIPSTQPTTPGFWLNNGVLTFWNGTTNQVFDFVDGQNSSLFGTPLGDI